VKKNVDCAGENFVCFSGDTQKLSEAQQIAWKVEVHLLREPMLLQVVRKGHDKRKEQFTSQVDNEHLHGSPSLLLAETEDSKLIKGQEKQIILSRYEVHSSVWGSYWHTGLEAGNTASSMSLGHPVKLLIIMKMNSAVLQADQFPHLRMNQSLRDKDHLYLVAARHRRGKSRKEKKKTYKI
jgi:hypothetical protein